MSKISTCTEMFAARMDLPQTLALLNEMGFEFFDMAWKFVQPYVQGARPWAELESILAGSRARPVAIMGTIDFGVSERCFPEQMLALRRQIEAALALQAPLIRVFASNVHERYVDAHTFDVVIRNLREACVVLADAPVKLAIENHFGVTSNADDVLRILDGVGSPQVGVTLDPANFQVSKQDPTSAVRQLAERIMHVHLKDCLHTGTGKWFGYEYVEVGAGSLDYAGILAALKDTGYQGYLALEYERPEDVVRGTLVARRNLLALL